MSIYIALGGNQNAQFEGKHLSVPATFGKLCDLLNETGISVSAASNIWESPAWPDPLAQPAYNNAVIEIKTEISPKDLLSVLKTMEYSFGRREGVRNAARPLDLDIVDYKQKVLTTGPLTLPHPRMLQRAFVLFPLQEIAPNWKDPNKNRTIDDWIARLSLADVAPMKRLGSIN